MVDVFCSVHENRTMKPVDIVLRRGGRRLGRVTEGVNLIGEQRMSVWTHHN
jgi:hypothetical protein